MEWLGCHGYSYTSLTEDPFTIWKGPAILFVIIKLECVEYRKIRSGFLFFLAICKRKGVEDERLTVSGMFLKCVRHVRQKMLNSFSAASQTKSKQLLETGDVNVKSLQQSSMRRRRPKASSRRSYLDLCKLIQFFQFLFQL